MLDAGRTPFGRRGGALALWHPVDLAAELIVRLAERAGAGPGTVGAVVMGCVSQVGAQAYNLARRAVLAAGWPEGVPGVTLDCHAASSALAVHWAVEAVASGAHSLVVAGGTEVMTAVPLGASLGQPTLGKPLSPRLLERYPNAGGFPPPGLVAEEVARRWKLSRADLDNWAARSYERASAAQASLPPYLVPVGGSPGKAADLHRDENLGHAPNEAQLKALPPAYKGGGVVTAANMAREGDGAGAVVMSNLALARRLGRLPKARVAGFATAGADPLVWPLAMAPATRAALRAAHVSAADVDWWFVHESSAAAVLAWSAETGVPLERVNPDGGELATTSPLGAVGASLFALAVSYLASRGAEVVAVCVAGEGGVGTACVLERTI